MILLRWKHINMLPDADYDELNTYLFFKWMVLLLASGPYLSVHINDSSRNALKNELCRLYADHIPKDLLLSNTQMQIAITYGPRLNESWHFSA